MSMEATMSEKATSTVTVHHLQGRRKVLHAGLGFAIRTWQRSLRYERLDQISTVLDASERTGGLILLWHNRIFPILGAVQQVKGREHRVRALVSASRDGAKISDFLHSIGIMTVRGSSSRRASVATKELVQHLRAGERIAITVDGPRGPCYRAHAGAAFLLQHLQVPAFLLGAECDDARCLKSWDRFLLPMPGSRVRLSMRPFQPPDRAPSDAPREALKNAIQRQMEAITHDHHLRP